MSPADDPGRAAVPALEPALPGGGAPAGPPGPRVRRVRRTPVVLAVLALLGGAVYLDQTAEPARPPGGAPAGTGMAVLPPADATSAAWYCAEGTSSPGGRADETVVVGNLSETRVTASVTVLVADASPSTETFVVAPHAQGRLRVADVVAAAEPGVVVETSGGLAVVEHELRGGGDVALGPCARQASRSWFFAAGTTRRGAAEYLALFNPFGDDAIVDVDFATNNGSDQPAATRSLVVPRRSRVTVAVHEVATREDAVGIAVRARTGRVVAERSLFLDGSDGLAAGMAVSPGSTVAGSFWRAPLGTVVPGAFTTVAVANFGLVPASVEVTIDSAGAGLLEPQTQTVGPGTVVSVDLAQVADPRGITVFVRSTSAAQVVAEVRTRFPGPDAGVTTVMGAIAGARRWAFAAGRPQDGDAVLAVLNLSGRPLTVSLLAFEPGSVAGPRSEPERAVAPGQRAVFVLTEVGARPDQVLMVTANGPVVVSRTRLGGGASQSMGVPGR